MPETRRLGGTLLQEQTAPSTPPTGFVAVYTKSDGRLYVKDDAGAELGFVDLSTNQTIGGAKTFGQAVTVPNLGALVTPAVANARYSFGGDTNFFANAPFANYIWHDQLAFNRPGAPTQEKFSSGAWSADTLNNNLFAGVDSSGYTVADGTTVTAVRWTWNGTGVIGWSGIRWWVIGYAYAAGQNKSVLIESSANGSSWTTRHTSSGDTADANVSWYQTDDNQGDEYLRITLTTTGGLPIRITSIRALSARWADQGGGSDKEFPYTWNWMKEVTFPAYVSMGSGLAVTNAVVTPYVHDPTSTRPFIDLAGNALGGTDKIGAIARTSAQIPWVVQGAASQTGNLQQWRDNGGGILAAVAADGSSYFKALTISEIAAPSTPAAGSAVIYAKSDGKIYSKDDAGVEYDLTGGGSGTPAYTTTIGDGSTTAFTITHNLGTKDVVVYAYSLTSPYNNLLVDIEHDTTNAVGLNFAVAPATNTVRVVVTTGGMGPAGSAGVGVPTGGTTGQALTKTSGTDYATGWLDVSLTSSGAGAPGSTPSKVGNIYIDTTADRVYVATDTASSADWDLLPVTGAQILALLLTVDGAGSGLDADTLDGIDSGSFVRDTGNESIGGIKTFTDDPIVPAETYGSGWNSSNEVPTKNDVYDKIEAMVANMMGYVNHGSTAGTARPSGYAAITWYGSVQPSNAVAGDIWVDTA